jgi:murein DD-endopeptidase MepM/ murein hydrolase activator NlpD
MFINRIITLHKPFLFFCFQIFFSSLFAQLFPEKNYPKGYFIYPVHAKPGLAANFGELRPNHYHMGLDIRTDQKQNVNVLAAADGYISHIKIEPAGFGRAIYINHPNGLTTLYAHLNDFFPELDKYLKQQQYKLESWQVFLDIPPKLFPVKQNQFIAFSGNTGGSQGPHLHFEIRNTKTDKVLNPSLFGFPIPDIVPPTLIRLAVYDRCMSTYSQTPKLYPLKKVNGKYVPTSPLLITNTDKVSFGLSAVDRYTGSANPNGIYEAILYNDGKPIAGFQLDNISYDETRYLNAHIDHKLKTGGGPYIEHLSRLPGYPESVYKDFESDGVINLEDDSLHQIKVEVKDAYGNASVIEFGVKRGLIKENKYDQQLLHLQKFSPGYINVFEREDIQVVLGESDLYDSINFIYAKKNAITSQAISAIHTVHTALVPIHGYFTIRIKADNNLKDIDEDKIIIQRTWGSKMDVVKPEKNGEWFTGKFREFGNFQLVVDNVAPVIIPIGIRENANLSRASQIIFTINDNMKKIKNFRAELDGRWLRFSNDKGRSFIYKFDEMCPPGNHELKVSVADEAGNVATKTFHFVR